MRAAKNASCLLEEELRLIPSVESSTTAFLPESSVIALYSVLHDDGFMISSKCVVQRAPPLPLGYSGSVKAFVKFGRHASKESFRRLPCEYTQQDVRYSVYSGRKSQIREDEKRNMG